MHEEVI